MDVRKTGQPKSTSNTMSEGHSRADLVLGSDKSSVYATHLSHVSNWAYVCIKNALTTLLLQWPPSLGGVATVMFLPSRSTNCLCPKHQPPPTLPMPAKS